MEAVDPIGNTVLVIVDTNFNNLCKDPQEYVSRLKVIFGKRGNNTRLVTVSGRYGLGAVDKSLSAISVDDKNKTLFGQTLENISMVFDELLIITINPSDPYLLAAKEVVTNSNKTITQYAYSRRS